MRGQQVVAIENGQLKIYLPEANLLVAIDEHDPKQLRLDVEVIMHGLLSVRHWLVARYYMAHPLEVPNDLAAYIIRLAAEQQEELAAAKKLFGEIKRKGPTRATKDFEAYVRQFMAITKPPNKAQRQEEHKMALRVLELLRAPKKKSNND